MLRQPENTNQLAPVLPPGEQKLVVKIDGVRVEQQTLVGDERGVLLEVVDTRASHWDLPVVYGYMVTCRPGKAKGWGWHGGHDDRYAILSGEMILALYDDREDSPTHGAVQEFYLSREGRNRIIIPRGVWHAHVNPGLTELLFMNFPTEHFNHSDPDKRTLPIDTDRIPYTFKTGLGR